MARAWMQNVLGTWILVDGDDLIKGPQSSPDADGVPRVPLPYEPSEPDPVAAAVDLSAIRPAARPTEIGDGSLANWLPGLLGKTTWAPKLGLPNWALLVAAGAALLLLAGGKGYRR